MNLKNQARAKAYKDISLFIGPSKHAKDDYFDVYDIRLKHVFSNELNPIEIKPF